MIKILHLLSDLKFADIHIARFNDPGFENHFVYLSQDFHQDVRNQMLLQQVVLFSHEYKLLQEDAGNFDLVFVYNLDYSKACFINGMAAGVMVIWHLYGTELYNHYHPLKYNIYSGLTRRVLKINRFTILADRGKRIVSRIKYRLLRKRPDYDEIKRAVTRIDFLAWYSRSEYCFLQERLPFELPSFFQLSVLVKEPATAISYNRKEHQLWLGNSASPENNHADILILLEKLSFAGSIIMPFSYGNNPLYSRFVKQFKSSTRLEIMLVESFQEYNEFSEMLATCSVAVFNSHRQMALGNIFLALKFGLKIYLNEMNPSLIWLKELGFFVYSIQQDLTKDLLSNELTLAAVTAKQNEATYQRLTAVENNHLFLTAVSDLVRCRNTVVQQDKNTMR